MDENDIFWKAIRWNSKPRPVANIKWLGGGAERVARIKGFEIFRLVWTIRYVYKELIWRAELCLCRFQFASYQSYVYQTWILANYL